MRKPIEYSPAPSSIQKKIELAHNLYATWGNKLLGESHIHNLMEKVKQNIETTRRITLALGIFDMCKHCDEEEGGSCCGAGIENKYSAVLLLINLILGVSLPEKRCKGNSCFFLNENGCALIARHVLCVNYLCSKIKQILTLDELIKIQYTAGNELDTVFILHEAIKKLIRGNNHVH